jgi:hypothetical protein
MPARFVFLKLFKKGLIGLAERSLMANQTSKTMSTRSSVFGVAFFFVSSVYALAGSAAGGGAQIAPTDNSSVSTYKVTDTSPGANAQVSAGGASTSQPGASSSTNASSAGASSTDASSSNASSSNGVASSNGNAPSGYGISPRATRDSSDFATQIAREKVIDTGDKGVETDKQEKSEPSDKTFAPHLLDTVSDISAVSAQKEHGSGSKTDDSKSAASEDKNDSRK